MIAIYQVKKSKFTVNNMLIPALYFSLIFHVFPAILKENEMNTDREYEKLKPMKNLTTINDQPKISS